MRKEYSDLSDKQKLIYIKRSAITFVCGGIPLMVLMGMMFFTVFHYIGLVENAPIDAAGNSTGIETKTRMEINLEFKFVFIAIIGASGMVGLAFLGFSLGDWVCDKLQLYTDFELGSAERRVAEIKKVMASEASAPKEP